MLARLGRLLARLRGSPRRRLLEVHRAKEDLAIAAESFLRSGGVLLLEDLRELELDDQIALLEANERIWTTRIVRLAHALKGSEGEAQVLAPFDDGLALRTVQALRQLEQLADRVVATEAS